MPAKLDTATKLTLELLPEVYVVCRLEPGAPAPPWPTKGLFSVTRTPEELSVVCAEECAPEGATCQHGWRCLKVRGPLDFALVGVLASLSAPLAASGVSIFVISTYDTDYLLVCEYELERAIAALERAGHKVIRGE